MVALIKDTSDPLANTYATLEDAAAYLDTVPVSQGAVWASETLTDDDRTRLLVWSTRLLNQYVTWVGTKVAVTQPLEWPRVIKTQNSTQSFIPLVYTTSEVVNTPLEVTQATVELARLLLDDVSIGSGSSDTANIKEIEAGATRIVFRDTALAANWSLPASVIALLRKWGTFKAPGGNFMRQITVVR